MKKHFILFACAVLSMSLFAQSKKTEPVSFSFTMNFESGYSVDVRVKTSAYYDENDEKAYHGAFTASGSENVNNNGVTGKFSYSASGTYKDGYLDGPIKITKNEYVANRRASAKIDASLSGAYKDGVPVGTWTISYGGSSTGEGKATLNYTLTFKDGEVASVVNNDGVNVRLEPTEGKDKDVHYFLISGTVEKTTFKKGYDATDFKRITSEWSKLDDDARAALDDL
ncbi:MAG: hypothetical protein II144_01085, partial [Paludibacteraceae bacterium]|nr:hypothetical protein [Paludibacteraceae bacterium]